MAPGRRTPLFSKESEKVRNLLAEINVMGYGAACARFWDEFLGAAGWKRFRYPVAELEDSAVLSEAGMSRPEDLLNAFRCVEMRGVPVVAERFRLQQLFRDEIPTDYHNLSVAAARLIEGEIALYGDRFLPVPRGLAWNQVPWSKRTIVCRHYSRMKFGGADVPTDDVRLLLELHRMSFVTLGARAFWLLEPEQGDRIARKTIEVWADWLDENPPGHGIAWAINLDVAERACHWLWALMVLRHWPCLDERFLWRALKSLLAHARHIAREIRHTRRHSRTNHLLGEACSLVLLGSGLPFFRSSASWRETGAMILRTEMERQFTSDGWTVEQSLGYFRYVLEIFFWAGHVSGMEELIVPLKRAVPVVLHLVHPDGSMAAIGDNDDSRFLFLTERSPTDFRPFLALAAVVARRAEAKAVAGEMGPELIWALGERGASMWECLGSEFPQDRRLVLMDGGWAAWRDTWRSGGIHLLMRCGRSGLHGHADQLHFALWGWGKPWLVDPNTGTYNSTLGWRDAFRQSAAHNTLEVGGKAQGESRRAFRWLYPPSGEWLGTGSQYGLCWWWGRFLGFSRHWPGLEHRRLWVVPDHESSRDVFEMLVVDQVLPSRRANSSLPLTFHFHGGEGVWQEEELNAWSLSSSGGPNKLWILSGHDVPPSVVNFYSGNQEPLRGWVSERFGQVRASPTLQITFPLDDKIAYPWKIRIERVSDSHHPAAPLRTELTGGVSRICCVLSDRPVEILLGENSIRFETEGSHWEVLLEAGHIAIPSRV